LELGTERWKKARCDHFNPGGRDLCNSLYKRLAGPELMSCRLTNTGLRFHRKSNTVSSLV